MTSPVKMLGVVALLAVGATVFAISLSRQFGSKPGASDGGGSGETLVVDESGRADPPPGADLLAAYGSYRPGTTVADPFVWLGPQTMPAAPAGEGATPATGTPFRPAPMTVTLVLLADPVARAVVDGRVVGPGDTVAAGTVERVTREGIEVHDGSVRLFYELRRRWPRGYEPPAAGDADRAEHETTPEGAEPGERK